MASAVSDRARKAIKQAVSELWGWAPNGKQLTPEQQAGCVRDEIRFKLGPTAKSIEVRVREHDGSLVVEVIFAGAIVIETFPSPEPRDGIPEVT